MVVIAGLFGLLIGSFLNVVVWRLPRGESLSHPGSHCPVCEHGIRPYDNIPVVSWVVLRGRCRDCGTRISARYPLVEMATGVLFGLTAWWVGFSVLLPFALWFTAACIALFLIDLEVRRLPNSLTLSTYVVVLVGFTLTAVAEDLWASFVRALVGGLALALVYALLAAFFPRGMGWGDAKLALSLGSVMAWVGWGALIVGGFGAFVLGAVWGVGAIVVGKAGRKSALPFGPFMIVAALLARVWGQQIADWYTNSLI
ncbi:MAG: Type 4 prepilin-like proteins leader peptide-processing enzyme [Actinobacteria bacterium ADurb.Bin444]|nr:MAG: Type 4 prepilin-like proteins leader peptide-processing enzyme [Actinobacteria bacterium ADurb.Bin444]